MSSPRNFSTTQKKNFGDAIAECSIPVFPSPGTNTSPNARARLIDFSKSPLQQSYPNHYALVIDNLFTPEECQDLIQGAENSTSPPAEWKPAEVNIGAGMQKLMTDIRNNGRIIWDDEKAADFIFQKVKPFLEDKIQLLGGSDPKWKQALYGVHNSTPAPRKDSKVSRLIFRNTNPIDKQPEAVVDRWQMTRINERLRFLKYGPGEFFERHRDGCFSTLQTKPDEPEERSHLTVQVYLSSSADLVGGETTFYGQWGPHNETNNEIPVEPIQGRVLVFQHRQLCHSGGVVTSGEKIVVRSDIMYKNIDAEVVANGLGKL